MIELADVFRRHAPAYIEKYGRQMPPSHYRAVADIINCRTEALGGHVFLCANCQTQTYSYHSCKNRACPKCHTKDTETWLHNRRREILPIPYFHVTITLPDTWRHLVRSNQKDLYAIMMKAAADSIMKLAADNKYVGGKVGLMAVLHTWTRTLHYHPHVHCLVTGGGLSTDGKHWLSSRDGYLFPKKAISPIFRGLFLDAVRKKRPDLQIPKDAPSKKWVVHLKAAGHGTGAVLEYLGRYVHRVALSNSRIKALDDNAVTFTYTDSTDQRLKTMTLDPMEFMRRFLQHVPPKGFHKVRYYGLWSTAKQEDLKNIRLILDLEAPITPIQYEQDSPNKGPLQEIHPMEGKTCPHCGKGALSLVGIIRPSWMKPP